MKSDKRHIAELLDRFMAGNSTLDEERQIARYMASHEVDDEWQPFKEMFAYFDKGMSGVEAVATTHDDDNRQRMMPLWWRWAVAATVLVAVVGVVLWLWRSAGDGQAIHNDTSVIAQVEDSIPVQPAVAEQVANKQPSQSQTINPMSARQYPRRSKPAGTRQVARRKTAPPATPVTASDSMILAKMQGELELAQMSVDAEYMMARKKMLATRLECELAILQARNMMHSLDDKDEQSVEY